MFGRPRRLLLAALLLLALAPAARPAAAVAGADADNDGLPDAWETGPGRAYGCDTKHADLLLYTVERTDLTAKVTDTLARATTFFNALRVKNPDGLPGIHLHVIRGPKTTRTDEYPQLMDALLPKALVGRAHFVVFSDNPGGQTNGNASIVGVAESGVNTLVHELGHQLGLEHEARGFKVQSPLHASVMNYAYMDAFEGSPDKFQYSDGQFARVRMRETALDETLAFPIASLQFLAADPYRFPLKPIGPNATQVDWNRNGVFGDKGVRADINYFPSSYLGDRLKVEPSATAPAGAYVGNEFFVAYGVSGPSGVAIVLRKLLAGNKWSPRISTRLTGAVGDPTLVALNGVLWLAAATATGESLVALEPSGDTARVDPRLSTTLPVRSRQPTLAVLDDHLFLFSRDPTSDRIFYAEYSGSGRTWGAERDAGLKSRTAPGLAWHPIRHEVVIVTTADANAKLRLVANFRALTNSQLSPTGERDWIGGQTGPNASSSRAAVLIDTSKDAGPQGRVYAYYQASQAGLPAFFSMQVADRAFHGGWLERSAYDEWSITESAPSAVANPAGDITYCYRDKGDNMLNCSFNGSGVQDADMGDADELTFIRTEGLRQALVK